jgi:hypothetical protein
MVTNDEAAIGAFMAEEWRITGSDGNVTDKKAFLTLIRSGALTHNVMSSDNIEIHVFGRAAVVTSTGISGGVFKGRTFLVSERSTNVFARHRGVWKCVATHLSNLPRRPGRKRKKY